MKNSLALRCASAQSVTKGACWSLRSCRDADTGKWRSGIPRDEEDPLSDANQIAARKLGWAKPSLRSSVARRLIWKLIPGAELGPLYHDSLLKIMPIIRASHTFND